MNKYFLSGLLLLCLWNVSLQAATTTKAEDSISSASTVAEESTVSEVRWYQIELLIFKQKPLSTEIAELWPRDIVLNYPENWDSLKTPDEYQAMYQKKSVVNTPFILLDKKQFQFSGIEKKLQINRNDILFHGAWRQSLTQNLDQKGETQFTPILIRGGEHFDDHTELEGSITLSLLRYLHVDTNLWLTRFAPVSVTATSNPPASTSAATDTKAAPLPVNWPELPTYPLLAAVTATSNPQTVPADGSSPAANNPNAVPEKKYQVDEIALNKQSRRMRSYETHYIDHPKFGILIRMTPLDTNTMLPLPPKK